MTMTTDGHPGGMKIAPAKGFEVTRDVRSAQRLLITTTGSSQIQRDYCKPYLLGIERKHPKVKAPPLKAATPEACGEFGSQWGEFTNIRIVVEAEISMKLRTR